MKKIIAMLLAVVMMFGLVACGGNTTPETQAPETKPAEVKTETTPAVEETKKYEGVELTFWSMWNESEPQGQVINQVVEAFKEETGATVNVVWKGRDINQILSASLEAGEAFDIYEDDYQRIALNYADYTADLTELAAAANYQGYPCLNNQVIAWAGHLNSIVEQPQVGGVFYDKDAFAKAGASEPTTWAEFLEVCEQLKAAGVAPLALDSAYSYFTFYHQLVRHLGEEKLEEIAVNGGWSDSAAVTAAQEIIDFVAAGNLVDGAPDEFPASENKVGFGLAAMVVCANYVTSEVNNNCGVQLNWGLFNYPMVDGSDNTAAYGGANSLAITESCENKQAAFDFIMMMTTGEFDQLMADTCAQIPADPTNTAPAHLSGTIETLLAADQPMTWCAATNANSDLVDSFKAMFNEIYEGKYASGEEFCAALDALYN